MAETFAQPDDFGEIQASELQGSLGETLGAHLGEAFGSGVRTLARIGEHQKAEHGDWSFAAQVGRLNAAIEGGSDPAAAARDLALESSTRAYQAPEVPIGDARTQLKQQGLDRYVQNMPDQPTIKQPVLDLMLAHARERRDYETTLSRGPQGFLPGALGFVTEMGAGMIDPINVAAFAIPVLGEARWGTMLAGAGESLAARAGVRALQGAAQGAAGGAALLPADWWLHTKDGQDYTMADALRSVVLSAGMGAGFHAGFGALGDVRARVAGRPLKGSIEDLQTRAVAGDVQAADVLERMGKGVTPQLEAGAEPAAISGATNEGAEISAPPIAPAAAAEEIPGISPEAVPPHPAQALADLPPRVQEDAVRAAMADVIAGRPVRAGEMLGEAAKEEPRIAESLQGAPERRPDQAVYDDVHARLIAAGLPEDQAMVSALLFATRYRARAERLEGRAGTALDLYRAENIDIRPGEEAAPAGDAAMAESALEQPARIRAADLFRQREAEGQTSLPGTERIGEGELAQRRADRPLKPKAEQKPMDFGLFGDEAKQKTLFQEGRGERDARRYFRVLSPLEREAFGAAYGPQVRADAQRYGWEGIDDIDPRTAVAQFDQVHSPIGAPDKGAYPAIVRWRGRDVIVSGSGKMTWAVQHGVASVRVHVLDLDNMHHLPREEEPNLWELRRTRPQAGEVEFKASAADEDGAPRTLERFRGSLDEIVARQEELQARHPGEAIHYDEENGPHDANELLESELLHGTESDAQGRLAELEAKGGEGEWEYDLAGNAHRGRYKGPEPDEAAWNRAARLADGHEQLDLHLREVLQAVADGGDFRESMALYGTRELAELFGGRFEPSELFQSSTEGPRGRITLGENRAIIELFKKADASTFMHESAHLWLGELVRDAAHPEAPAQLRDDLKTVLDWLGVEKPGDIGVPQHEQWARGFERYLMEGKAPSSRLAAVFEAFKRWMTELYKSVRALRSDVSDDVRGVMDRMLASDAEIAAHKGAVAAEATPTSPRIDATHDVVSGANSSKDPNGPVYIDRRIPQLSPKLKDGNGQPLDLWKYLAVHEEKEAAAMRDGMSYDDAHAKVATPAERAAVEADGGDWKAYTHEIDGYLSAIEHEKAANPPPDTHVDPQAAIGHHRASNKQAAAAVAETGRVLSGPKAARGPRARPEETWSLMEFLVSRGGISPDERNIGDVTTILGRPNKSVPFFGNLIRKGGMTLDRAREAAVEAGYLRDAGEHTGGESTSRINDLLEALDEEARGRRQYREGIQAPHGRPDPAKVLHELNSHLETELEAVGIRAEDIEPALRDRAVEIMHRERESDPLAAYERAVMEKDLDAAEAGHVQPATEEIPGWSISDDAGAAPRPGERAQGAGQPGGGEPGGAARAPGGRDREEAQRASWRQFADAEHPVTDADLAAESRAAEAAPEPASVEPAKAVSAAQAEAAKADRLLEDILPTLSEDERKVFTDALAELDRDREAREQMIRDGAACLAEAAA